MPKKEEPKKKEQKKDTFFKLYLKKCKFQITLTSEKKKMRGDRIFPKLKKIGISILPECLAI